MTVCNAVLMKIYISLCLFEVGMHLFSVRADFLIRLKTVRNVVFIKNFHIFRLFEARVYTFS